jgi:hypothetical protein
MQATTMLETICRKIKKHTPPGKVPEHLETTASELCLDRTMAYSK